MASSSNEFPGTCKTHSLVHMVPPHHGCCLMRQMLSVMIWGGDVWIIQGGTKEEDQGYVHRRRDSFYCQKSDLKYWEKKSVSLDIFWCWVQGNWQKDRPNLSLRPGGKPKCIEAFYGDAPSPPISLFLFSQKNSKQNEGCKGSFPHDALRFVQNIEDSNRRHQGSCLCAARYKKTSEPAFSVLLHWTVDPLKF